MRLAFLAQGVSDTAKIQINDLHYIECLGVIYSLIASLGAG